MTLALVGLLSAPSTAALAVVAPMAAADCSPSSDASGSGSGISMTATVLGPDGCPVDGSTGGGSSGGGAGTGGRPGGSASGTGAVAGPPATVATAAVDPTPTADEIDLGGILYIGGLSSSSVPSVNPFGGDLQLWFTVRNVSDSTIEASADFWMAGPFGNRISSVDGVVISDLKPGETRTVGAELPGVGQWTVLSAHATLNPPESVNGTVLAPVTRDATVFALPWLVVLLIAAGLTAWVVVQIARRREGVEPLGAVGALA
ncbi:hypothetical protein ACFXP7_01950 [Microbacterium sp. P06]|uniref:hypothetical protein n=1 Tax=Microbacterium sp. P06 TaxID=3366949 RepID=UPI003746F556